MPEMKRSARSRVKRLSFAMGVSMACVAVAAEAGEYDRALRGVDGVRAVFDVSQGAPAAVNTIFWMLQDVYKNPGVADVPGAPQVVVMFSRPAGRRLSADCGGFRESDRADLDRFAQTLRQMERDGVRLEVCLYAAKVMNIAPATLMREVDRVGSGFVSVAGYQAPGYPVVRIP